MKWCGNVHVYSITGRLPMIVLNNYGWNGNACAVIWDVFHRDAVNTFLYLVNKLYTHNLTCWVLQKRMYWRWWRHLPHQRHRRDTTTSRRRHDAVGDDVTSSSSSCRVDITALCITRYRHQYVHPAAASDFNWGFEYNGVILSEV